MHKLSIFMNKLKSGYVDYMKAIIKFLSVTFVYNEILCN